MATSDNVVRAGFTPKFKNIPTLISMLTYTYAPIADQKLQPTEYPYCTHNLTAHTSGSECLLYDPPIEEFSVILTNLKKEGAKVTFEAIQGPAIYICTEGEGTIAVGPKTCDVKAGYVFFVGASATVVLEAKSAGFVTYKAFCELNGKEGPGEGSKI